MQCFFSEISAMSYAVQCSRNTLDRNGSCVKKAHPFGVFPTWEAAVEDEKAQNTFCL
jgi:hypothetical protein